MPGGGIRFKKGVLSNKRRGGSNDRGEGLSEAMRGKNAVRSVQKRILAIGRRLASHKERTRRERPALEGESVASIANPKDSFSGGKGGVVSPTGFGQSRMGGKEIRCRTLKKGEGKENNRLATSRGAGRAGKLKKREIETRYNIERGGF